MIKVMIVFYGLVMFVPHDGGLRVLFIDGQRHMPKHGEHMPTSQVVLQDGTIVEPWALGNEFKIQIQGPAGTVDHSAQADFAQLEELFTYTSRGLVRKKCLHDDPSCRKIDGDIVRGWTHIQGAWSTKPATHCNGSWNPPIKFDDTATFEFRRTATGPPRDGDPRLLATALRLDAEVSEDELAHMVRIGDSEQKLDWITGPTCQKWLGEPADRCIILLIGNPPGAEARCESGYCPFDEHFTGLYRPTLDPPWQMNRWLPYILTNYECPEGYPRWSAEEKRNHPAPRCPPTYATVEP